jgi:hypothetical protein
VVRTERGPGASGDPVRGDPVSRTAKGLPGAGLAGRARGGHRRANGGSWLAVILIICGFVVGCVALPTHSVVLWIVAGAAIVVGGAVGLASRIMEQAY